MNIIADVFGIFQGQGLAQKVKEKRKLEEFVFVAFVLICVFTALYGLAMGISVSLKVGLRDMVKIPLIFLFTLLISYPAYYIPLKIVGVKESNRQILVSIITMFFVAGLTLAIASPIIFFYGLAGDYLRQYYFIHIVIIDLALIGGLIIMSFLLNRAVEIEDKSRLVIPVIIGTIFVGLALWVLILFWGPYFEEPECFSRGIQRLIELFTTVKIVA
ncbi:MAG: hypothetical protein HY920_07065 [Elusimicrobia bacterium]|nr:hypothetical protein [Elusimicrobiota bacterium]